MPLTHSTNIVFTPTDFTSSSPVGGVTLAQNLGINNVSNIKWANKTRQLNLGNTNYGYATFDISYTITGTADVIGVSFYSESTILTYSTTLSGLFKPVFEGEYIKLTPGVTTRLYVIVNALTIDSTLPINFIIGKKGTPPSNVTINLQYNCNDVGPLYKYLMGLHAYSAYDALNNPSLQTYLYSYTPIGSWTTNTEVYSAANFSHPAYPYYYGYSGNVYKVGDELERSFGTKYYFECIKWWAFGDTKTYTKTIGPKAWLTRDDTVLATDNFVFPEMPAVGKLKKIIPSANIVQPSSYRYYMGVASTQQASADYFTQFDFQNRTSHTIAGSTHAMSKLSQGFTNGFKGFVKFDYEPWGWLVWLGASIVQNSIWSSTNTTNATTLLQKVGNIWAKADGFYTRSLPGTSKALFQFKGFFTGGVLPGGIPIVVVVIIIIIIILIVKLFKPTKVVFEEPPIKFRYRYANTPYLNNGTRLYKNTTLSVYSSEYYCDGIYFYNQTGGTIANKELSYSTNALINNDPIRKGFAYSLKADQPDSGSVLSDFTKLAILPYCSGKPDTVSSTNINTTQTATFTPLNKGGDLLTYPLTVTVEIPEGTIITTGSQVLANAEAKNLLNELTSSYAASGSYGQTISGIDGFGAFFTHEIKVETYPNTGSVFFNNNDGSGLTAGKALYYDQAGYLKVSNGYYAATTESYASASYHRTFYKTVNGSVTDILSMTSAVATTVTSLVNSATYPIQTSNQNHTSDWYWYDISYNDLKDNLTPILESKPNPNSLYATSSLKAGFCTPDTSSFYTYNSIPSTASYSEATPGFYYAFSSYENPYIFTYSTPVTLSINLTEVCFTDYTIGEPYGINISGASGSASSSLYYPVNMTLNAYNGGSLITSFPATASAEGITYVDFPAPITKDSNVTNVTIDSISSPNPNNKILYTAGTFTNCNPTTPAPTTAAPTTAAPTTASPTPNPTTPSPTTASPTTAAPTTAPTTAAPTPNPTTASPTPAPTNPFGGTIYYSTISAFDVCNNASMPLSVTGNNGDFCSSTIFTGAGWTSLPQNTYWIKYIGDTKVVQVYHASGADNVGRVTGCNECPTPSPTAAPTTSSPTTASPTAAPTTASPTTAPTTAAPTTPNPTTPPTPAPTSPFGGTIEYSSISAADVCNNGSTPLVVTGNNGTFCTSTIFTGVGWPSLPTGTYWIKWIGDTKVVQVFHASNADNVGRITGCNECPTPSPTTAPTTASPTTPPTPPPTPPPTTASPTTPPTPPPTTPPTPAPTAPFAGNIEYSTISAADVCNNGSTPISVIGNNSTFCNSTIFTGAGWQSLAQNTYWIKYIGDTKVVQVYHASGADNVGRVTGCNECPTPSPTAAPTTASPTTPPTPPPTTPPTPPPTTPPTPPPTTPPTPPPTTPPTPPPTPPPTTPPTPPPTTPPTPPPTPSPTEIPYYYYVVRPCFSGSDLVARSLDPELNGVFAANGTCYFIIEIAVPGDWAFTIGTADYQGGSCYVAGCGYSPPPIAPPPTSSGWECEPFVGCYESVFSIQSQFECNQSCPQPM